MHGLENIKIKESKDYMIDEVRKKLISQLSDIEKLKAENRLVNHSATELPEYLN